MSHDHFSRSAVDPAAAHLMRWATRASVTTALTLIGVKFYAWLMTSSVSILSSLVDSGLDMVISLVNLLAVRYALEPPDKEHRFGHTAAEDVAALAQAAFIAGSAMFITIMAVGRLLNPTPVTETAVGIGVMVFSITATFALVMFQRHVVKKTSSTAISADSLHYVGDLLMNASVILALLVSTQLKWHWADPLLALIIAVYILHGSWKIGRNAFDKLLDKEFDEEARQKVIDTILNHPGVRGFHELKTRHSGVKPFLQFHLDLDGNQTLNEAHEIADGLEKKLLEMFPGGEVVIHEDPVDQSKPTNERDDSEKAS